MEVPKKGEVRRPVLDDVVLQVDDVGEYLCPVVRDLCRYAIADPVHMQIIGFVTLSASAISPQVRICLHGFSIIVFSECISLPSGKYHALECSVGYRYFDRHTGSPEGIERKTSLPGRKLPSHNSTGRVMRYRRSTATFRAGNSESLPATCSLVFSPRLQMLCPVTR